MVISNHISETKMEKSLGPCVARVGKTDARTKSGSAEDENLEVATEGRSAGVDAKKMSKICDFVN